MGSNKAQQEIINTIDGPVLALAGPGSGKTRTLKERIKNMLKSPDHQIDTQNILCLTFTDNGAKEMRERLRDDIGVDSYGITIQTFHSFCSDVIKRNSDYFRLKDLDIVSELETIEILEEIIDELPIDHPIVRLKGDKYWEAGRLKKLFGLMKQENWSHLDISEHVNLLLEDLNEIVNKSKEFADLKDKELRDEVKSYLEVNPEYKEFMYSVKRGTTLPGMIKEAQMKSAIDKVKTLDAAAKLIVKYTEKMSKRNRYDYNDMIQWVIEMFKNDPNRLADYQEQYQYVLIDESQDTSGSQHAIVDLLINFWSNPNILMVGDIDQSLFQFCGARIKNTDDFIEKYNPKIVKMNQNYRSNSVVLNKAFNLIKRQSPLFKDGQPMSAEKDNNGSVKVVSVLNHTEELAYVRDEILNLISSGENPKDIAVIYRKHAHAEDLMKIMKIDGIPVNAKRKVNILDEHVIKQILKVFEYVNTVNSGRQADSLFAEIAHYDFINIDKDELYLYLFKKEESDSIIKAKSLLNELVKSSENKPPVSLLSDILYNTSLADILKGNSDRFTASVIVTFFDWLRDEQRKRSDMKIGDVLDHIRRMRSNNISINIESLMYDSEGVNFVTAHGSKGSEFKHVFIIRCNRSDWEAGRNNHGEYKLPNTLVLSTSDEDEKTQRRLFYVAMTRAIENLTITFSEEDNNGKKLEPSMFIYETEIDIEKSEHIDSTDFIIKSLTPESVVFNAEGRSEAFIQALKDKLEHYRLSPSHMAKYLECPLSFYYENILKVPYINTASMIVGDAIHYALETYYNNYIKGVHVTSEQFLNIAVDTFNRRKGELDYSDAERSVWYMKSFLEDFYLNYVVSSNKVTVNEYSSDQIIIDGVPVKIIIDKLEFNGNNVTIVDYKTGKAENIKKHVKPDGKIFDQLVFYGLGINNDKTKNWNPVGYKVVPVSSDFKEEIVVDITPEDKAVVRKKIVETYNNIQSLKFDGCGSPECKWCSANKKH